MCATFGVDKVSPYLLLATCACIVILKSVVHSIGILIVFVAFWPPGGETISKPQ